MRNATFETINAKESLPPEQGPRDVGRHAANNYQVFSLLFLLCPDTIDLQATL